jgi:hypothetical protein
MVKWILILSYIVHVGSESEFSPINCSIIDLAPRQGMGESCQVLQVSFIWANPLKHVHV